MIGSKPAAVTLVLVAVSSIVLSALAMTWYADSGGVLLSWFSLWVLAPAVLVLILAWRAPGRFRSIPVLAILALALAFGPAVYIQGLFAPPDAQSAFVFLFAPFWQLVGIGIALLLAFVLPRFARPRDAAN